MREGTGKTTILDRFALGFLNAIVGLPTALLLWTALNGFPWAVTPWLPAVSILWFTLMVAVIGAFTDNIFLVTFYGKLWHVLVKWFHPYK